MTEDATENEVSDEEFTNNVANILDRQHAEELEEQAEADDLNDESDEEITKMDMLKTHNPDAIEKLCREIENRLIEPANKRKQANDDVKAILSDGEAKGLNREAIKLAHKFLLWDNHKRDSFIASFQLYLSAHGYNMQQDLFFDPSYSAVAGK